MRYLITAIALTLSTQAYGNTPQAEQTGNQNAAKLDQTVQLRRTMRFRQFDMQEFSQALSLRQPSTYALFKALTDERRRMVLNAFNAGTNVTQLKSLIQSL